MLNIPTPKCTHSTQRVSESESESEREKARERILLTLRNKKTNTPAAQQTHREQMYNFEIETFSPFWSIATINIQLHRVVIKRPKRSAKMCDTESIRFQGVLYGLYISISLQQFDAANSFVPKRQEFRCIFTKNLHPVRNDRHIPTKLFQLTQFLDLLVFFFTVP